DAVSRVIVGDFFSPLDIARGANPDDVADDLRVTVRRARVIHVACDVAADGRVAHVEPVQFEAPDVPLLGVALLAPQPLLIGDFLASVVDDSRVLGDGLGGKNAPTLDSGPPLLNHQKKG